MKNLYIFGSIVVIVIFILVQFWPFKPREEVVLSAQDQQTVPIQVVTTSLPLGAEKIEVLHFHTTQQCISCINIGKFTKAVIEEKFTQEVKDGKIVFKTINIDLPENFKIAQDYKVSGSALYLNAIKDGKDNLEEDTTVWRLVTNETQLKSYFEAKLKKLL